MRISNSYATAHGNINLDADIENNVIINIKIWGDFILKPDKSINLLENHLRGVELKRELVANAINVFYILGIESNMSQEDFINALMGLKKQ